MLLTDLSDADLVSLFRDIVIDEQERLALQLAFIVEMDRRKLFFEHDCLRTCLMEEHGMEEWRAERLIRAARVLKRLPFLKPMIESGRINLTLLEFAQGCVHREKLSDEEFRELLEGIAGMSCRAAKREIARRFPRSEAELPKDRIRRLTEELSEVRFVATEELLEKLEEIRGLLAYSHPGIRLGELIDHLATDYRMRHHPEEKAARAKERAEMKEKKVKEATESSGSPTAPLLESNDQIQGGSPGSGSLEVEKSGRERRSFSKTQAHELTLRDGYRCAYVDPVTRLRCKSVYGLAKDHVRSWASGGKTEVSNARYACIQHHARISFLEFGEGSKYFKRNPCED